MILDASDLSKFQLIIMDVNIPEMSGFEVIKLYRFMSLGLRYVPIIGLVADASEETARRCTNAGIDAFIDMSTREYDLLCLIDKLIAFIGKKTLQKVLSTKSAPYPAMMQLGWAAAPIDMDVLKDLEMIGGCQFADDVVTAFLEEAPKVLCILGKAISVGDGEMFHNQMHILRSYAANIGAGALYQLCSDWNRTMPENITPSRKASIGDLRHEFERARIALQKVLLDRSDLNT